MTFTRKTWYFTRIGFLQLRGTQQHLEEEWKKTGKLLFFGSFTDNLLPWFPTTTTQQGDLSSCHQPVPLFHLFYLKNTACPKCFQQQLWCPQHRDSHLSVHDALWHKPRDPQEKDAAKERGEGSSQRQGELRSPHAESRCGWEKKHLKAPRIAKWRNLENKWEQCWNRRSRSGGISCWYLGNILSVPWGQQYTWGKL